MSNDFTPDADDQLPEKKSSQQLLLLLLLLLVLLFVYLYYFTSFIRPRTEEPKPQPVAVAPVKKPLPPRPQAATGEPAKAAQPAAKPGEPKVAQTPAKPGAPAKEAAAKPAKEVPAAKPAPAAKEAAVKPAAKPAPAGKEAAIKPAAAGKEAAGAKPAPAAKVAQAAKATKPAAAAAKPGAAKPAAQAKPVQKEGASVKTASAAKKAPVAKPAAFALELGDLAESEVNSVLAKLKQAGIGNVVKSKTHKGELMHRLFLADFADRNEAVEELERLKQTAPDAFMLKENGRYAVYAGSYMRDAKAASEQTRLQAKGVQLLPKTANLPVTVLNVRAGAFANQAAADKAVKSLKKAGLTAKVVRTAKVEK